MTNTAAVTMPSSRRRRVRRLMAPAFEVRPTGVKSPGLEDGEALVRNWREKAKPLAGRGRWTV
jgi:hypothetical protein